MAKFEFKLWQVDPSQPSALAGRLKGVPVSPHLLRSLLAVFVAVSSCDTRHTMVLRTHRGTWQRLWNILKDEKDSRTNVAFDPGCPLPRWMDVMAPIVLTLSII